MELDNLMLGSREICRLFGVTKTTLGNWVSNGFPRSARNQYPLKAGFNWWRRNVAEDTADEMKAARLKREQSKARLAELEMKEREGGLVRRDQAVSWVATAVSEAKSGFRNIPRRLGDELALINDGRDIFLILKRSIDQVLKELWSRGQEAKK